MSKWIWRFGEFEIWHNLLVHTRRQAYGFPEPPIWKVHMPDPVVRFVKETETEGGKIRIRALGSFTMMYYTGENYETESKTWGKEEVILPPGKVRIQILVQNRDSFPAIYVDGVVESDETWLASDATPDLRPVGCTDLLCDPEHTPDVFPFEYEEIKPVAKQLTEIRLRRHRPSGTGSRRSKLWRHRPSGAGIPPRHRPLRRVARRSAGSGLVRGPLPRSPRKRHAGIPALRAALSVYRSR